MSLGLLSLLRYFLIALIWLFFVFAFRAVWVEMRRQVRATSTARVGAASSLPASQAIRTDSRKKSQKDTVVLLAVTGPYAGRTFEFHADGVIGRDTGAAVSIPDDVFVSSQHARLFRDGRRTMIEDLGSRNGTMVNDDLVKGAEKISSGDIVQVGQTSFRVVSK
jgi:hypothetical protein